MTTEPLTLTPSASERAAGVFDAEAIARAARCVRTDGALIVEDTVDVTKIAEARRAFLERYADYLDDRGREDALSVCERRIMVTVALELAVFVAQGDLPLDPLVDSGRGMHKTTLIDKSTGDAWLQILNGKIDASWRIVSRVTVFGTTSDGQTIESNEAVIPVDLCFACLVTFPLGSDDPAQPRPHCLESVDSSVTQPCVIGQDQPIDCRLCQSNPVCIP